MGDWAMLIPDLLVQILERILVLEDFVAFGGVCRWWRSAAANENFNGPPQQMPWLMIAEKEEEVDGDYRRLVHLTKGGGGMMRKLILPEAKGKRCMATLGWFVTVGEDGEMSLLHPLSRAQIPLPHVSTFKYNSVRCRIQNNVDFVDKAVLSSSPSRNNDNDYVVMVIYGERGYLGFWKPGDKTWTTIETYVGRYFDITYYKGQFYGVNTWDTVLVCDVRGSDPTLRARLVREIPRGVISYKRSYIVQSPAGALLIVVRDPPESYLNFVNGDYMAYKFRVFELHLSNSNGYGGSTFSEVKSLRDTAVFVGHSASISVEASKFPGIKGNCIYFTDDCWDSYTHFRRGVGEDMGIYNLEDGSFTTYYERQSSSHVCPPMWVTPSLF